MIASPYATERTRAQTEGRAEREAFQNHNGKPFRTKSQKRMARESAERSKDGTWRSNAPVSHHKAPTK
jgi:hypothetical protein